MATDKQLMLLRHGKAFSGGGKRDHDRTLTAAGEHDVKKVAERARQQGWIPNLILSSSAVRAWQTAELFAQVMPCEMHIIREESLYLAHPQDILITIQVIPEEIRSLLIVGHNPGFETILLHVAHRRTHLPTAGLICCRLMPATWAQTEFDDLRFVELITPENDDDNTGADSDA